MNVVARIFTSNLRIVTGSSGQRNGRAPTQSVEAGITLWSRSSHDRSSLVCGQTFISLYIASTCCHQTLALAPQCGNSSVSRCPPRLAAARLLPPPNFEASTISKSPQPRADDDDCPNADEHLTTTNSDPISIPPTFSNRRHILRKDGGSSERPVLRQEEDGDGRRALQAGQGLDQGQRPASRPR